MLRLSFQRLCSACIDGKKLARGIISAANELSAQPHVYKKRYTEDELVKYLTDNVVYETDEFMVTSLPQGIKLSDKLHKHVDFEGEPICDVSLKSVTQKLRDVFNNSDNVFIAKYPRRNASGLLLLCKNYSSFLHLRNKAMVSVLNNIQIHNYLAVVSGCPKQTVNQDFVISQFIVGNHLETEVLESKMKGLKERRTKYSHRVIASKESVSLIHISVSYDERDCVRHILAQKCFSPVFGDLWNMKREIKFLMGAPLKRPCSTINKDPYVLDPELLTKLQLNPGDEKYIPIHIHFYSLSLPLEKKSEFFVSVPPPESFIWTCKQLGLDEIEQFLK